MLKDESGFLPTAAGGECQSVSEEEAVTCYVDHRPFDAILMPRDTEMGLCNKVFFFCFFFHRPDEDTSPKQSEQRRSDLQRNG